MPWNWYNRNYNSLWNKIQSIIVEGSLKKMKEETRVTIWSLSAAGMLCLVLVSASLTPLATMGHGTRFGTAGMWYNLWYVSSGYLIPLALYRLRVHAMKYVIGAVNGFWLIPLPFMSGIAFWGERPGGSGAWDCSASSFSSGPDVPKE